MRPRKKQTPHPWVPDEIAPIDHADFWPVDDGALDEYEQSLIERHRAYADEVHDAET